MIPTVKQALRMLASGQCTVDEALGWIEENIRMDASTPPSAARCTTNAAPSGQESMSLRPGAESSTARHEGESPAAAAPTIASTVGECAGPFVDAKDCPVHRKDTQRATANEAMSTKVQDFLRLPDNWDSYGARPFNSRTIALATEIARGLSDEWKCVPCADGPSVWFYRGDEEEVIQVHAQPAVSTPASSIEACYDAYDLFEPWNALTLHLGEEISENNRVWRYVHAFSEALARHHEAGHARYWSARPSTPHSATAAPKEGQR